MAIATPHIDREAVRLAAVAGVSYQTLARKYGLFQANGHPDTTLFRQWAKRGNWPIPARVVESSRRRMRDTIKECHAKGVTPTHDGMEINVTKCHKSLSGSTSADDAAVTIGENLQEIGQQGTLRAAQVALRSLTQAPESLPVASVSELKAALQVVRIAAGMDSGEGPTINLGLFAGNGSATAGAVYDVESSTPELETDDVFN